MNRFRSLILILLLIVLWPTTEWLLFRRTVPPQTVTDLNSFLNWRPRTTQFAILPEGEHLIATAPGGGLLPSGPSAYIFDRSGHLVAWSSDIGDNPDFDNQWQAQRALSTETPLPRSQLSAWLTAETEPKRDLITPR